MLAPAASKGAKITFPIVSHMTPMTGFPTFFLPDERRRLFLF
jgi:hypothetical protein